MREGPTHTSETIGEEIRERLGEMTPSERRVARTLLATYPTAGLESLPQLAEGAGVTGPTVLRFVRKIGFDGYPDFQRSLRQEVQARTEGLPSLYRTKGGSQDDEVLRQSHEAFTSALDATLTSSSLEQDLAPRRRAVGRSQAADLVRGRTVQPVRGELPVPADADAATGLRRRRRITAATQARHLEISRRDVLCLFDYRRYQQDTIAAGKVAADHGAVVVVFTDPWLSPAVEHARHVLISHADSASPFDSLLGAFALTEVIAAKVVVALGERGRTRVAELETVVEGLHDPLATVIDPDARGAEAG